MEGSSVEMEVDEIQADNVMASNVTASVTISLHPLVILNISEHWTRLSAQVGKSVPTLGALIGKQKDRNIEIMNSFELSYTVLEDSSLVIDRDYYNSKEEQFKQVSYYSNILLIANYKSKYNFIFNLLGILRPRISWMVHNWYWF